MADAFELRSDDLMAPISDDLVTTDDINAGELTPELEVLVNLLRDLTPEERAVVFAQFQDEISQN